MNGLDLFEIKVNDYNVMCMYANFDLLSHIKAPSIKIWMPNLFKFHSTNCHVVLIRLSEYLRIFKLMVFVVKLN